MIRVVVNQFLAVLKREFALFFRSPQAILSPVLFFIMVGILFPLAISPDKKVLQLIAPGVLWVAALLATLIALERLFKSEQADGSLEQMILNPCSLTITAFSKIFCHWCVTGIPLLLVTPLLMMMYHFSFEGTYVMELSLLIGTPVLIFLGAIGSALTVGLRNSGILLTLLILPFYVPVLIFGTSAVVAAVSGIAFDGQLAILGAFLALSVTLCPFAVAGALRICVNY